MDREGNGKNEEQVRREVGPASDMRVKRARVPFLGKGFCTGTFNLNVNGNTDVVGPSVPETPVLTSKRLKW